MISPDVSKFVACCKDFLHEEWANYKKSGKAKACPVCIYSIGGQNDIPAACLESVGNGFKELENVLKQTVKLTVHKKTPFVSRDIIVWANGQISLFPERSAKEKVDAETPSTAAELKPPPIPGRKPKPPPSPEAACMGGIEQVANYMLDHIKRVSETCFLNGNIKVLYYVLSSALLIKCRIMSYKQVLKVPSTKSLTSTVNRCNETIEIMTQHLLNYHSDLIRSSILLDAGSNDWKADRSYEENERISLALQMWCFYMQGVRNDLWRYTSTKVGENIFSNIFSDTLGLIVKRYAQITPSDMRLPQLRGDIATIFLIVTSFLLSLTPSPRFIFQGEMEESLVFSIHRRMDLLLRIAALKCASIETLAKVYSLGIYPSKRFSTNSKDPTKIESCPSWLTFFNRNLFPANTKCLSSLPDNVAIYLALNIAALRPYPDQGLILRGLFMRNFQATKVILRALQDVPGEVGKGKVCGGTLCLGCLCTPPLIPHSVYASILQIVVESFNSPQILNVVMQSGIKESGNWDSLDRMQVWNIQRPPWHHGLIQLVAVRIAPVVAQVLESVPAEPPAQPAHPSQLSVRLEHHLSAWTLQLINGVGNLADSLPACVVQAAQTINASLPPTIKPVGGHVISQLVISAIYSIINSRSSLDLLCPVDAITNGQWDMMVAVGERLCSLHDGNYDSALEQMTKSLLRPLSVVDEGDDENLDDYVNEKAIEEICQQMAEQVMGSMQGRQAFGIIWEYLKRNMEWIAHALQSPPLLPPPPSNEASSHPKVTPRMSFAAVPQIYNPLSYHERILFTPLKHEYLMGFEGNWESVLEGDLWLPKDMIHDLIKKRPEMQEDATLTPSESASVQKLKSHLR